MNRELVYFDVANLNFSAYFFEGFREQAVERGYRLRSARRLPGEIYTRKNWLSTLDAVSVYEVREKGERYFVCIDARDNNRNCHLPWVEASRYYFKVNYNPEALADNNSLDAVREKILPIRPFFPIATPWVSHWPRPWPAAAAGWGRQQMTHRLTQLRNLPALSHLTGMRGQTPVRDVAFVVPYYDQPGHAEHNEFRYEVMCGLAEHPEIDALAGFVGPSVPGKYARFHIDRVPPEVHLNRIATSRIAVYVRGVHDCVSYKFGELLCQGLPIVGQTIPNNRSVIMANPHFDEQFGCDTPQQMVDAIVRLLADDDHREALGKANAQTFDAVFAPAATVADVLDHIWP